MMAHSYDHHHHHHAGGVHPPAAVLPSFLRASLAQRLAVAASVIALLWLSVLCAIG